MVYRRKREASMANKERTAIQKRITDKFGSDAILKLRVVICPTCDKKDCLLIPLTIEGELCPYFHIKASTQ